MSGGCVALEVARRAPGRITALGLISTSARPDTPEQGAGRLARNADVIEGRFSELVERTFPALVDASHDQHADLMDFWRQTGSEVGDGVRPAERRRSAWCVGILLVAYALAQVAHRRTIS